MPHLTITRLKLKSAPQIPAFLKANEPTFEQVVRAEGFLAGKALLDFSGAAWTQTLWEKPENMKAFYLSGEHRKLMGSLNEFACEASTRSVELPDSRLPSWWAACKMLQQEARYSAILREPTTMHQQQKTPTLWFPLLSRPLRPVK